MRFVSGVVPYLLVPVIEVLSPYLVTRFVTLAYGKLTTWYSDGSLSTKRRQPKYLK